ncbi:MAG: sugar phosphate isomerase/epimerase [Verrucomicrobiaceae bacterium]|nr:MAG: sugar phosphate isomerase/epimerase [Verrucomicrobiaceae bacterium]
MADAAAIVRKVDSPGLRLQLDTGECAMNQELLPGAVVENLDIIGHVHISEPMLDDFSEPWEGHAQLSRIFAENDYKGVISLEMKRPSSGLAGVHNALAFVRDCYGRC